MLESTLSCVIRQPVITAERDPIQQNILSLPQSWGRVPLGRRPQQLALTLTQRYYVIADGDRHGPWRVHVIEYIYYLFTMRGEAVLAYHYHPDTTPEVMYPHLHVPSQVAPLTDRAHIPTGRVSLEAVIRFAISQCGVQPFRTDWRAILDANERAFLENRTWTYDLGYRSSRQLTR